MQIEKFRGERARVYTLSRPQTAPADCGLRGPRVKEGGAPSTPNLLRFSLAVVLEARPDDRRGPPGTAGGTSPQLCPSLVLIWEFRHCLPNVWVFFPQFVLVLL